MVVEIYNQIHGLLYLVLHQKTVFNALLNLLYLAIYTDNFIHALLVFTLSIQIQINSYIHI